MQKLQMAVREIVNHKDLHLNVLLLDSQLPVSCHNSIKLFQEEHFISTDICPAILMIPLCHFTFVLVFCILLLFAFFFNFFIIFLCFATSSQLCVLVEMLELLLAAPYERTIVQNFR